jgi:hypothetical protein
MWRIGRAAGHLARSKSVGRRLLSTMGEATETTTTTSSAQHQHQQQGTVKMMVSRVIKVTQSWSSLSPRTRLLIGCYAGGFAVHELVSSYGAGKEALEAHRLKQEQHASNKGSGSSLPNKTEWEAVRAGCREGGWERFWDSLVFPATLASKLMPHVVIWLNPSTSTPPISPRAATAPKPTSAPTTSPPVGSIAASDNYHAPPVGTRQQSGEQTQCPIATLSHCHIATLPHCHVAAAIWDVD